MKRMLFSAVLFACAFSPAFAAFARPAGPVSPEISAVNKDEGNLHWTLAPKAKYVKSIHDIFKKFQEGKYRKALDDMQELCDDSEKDEQKNLKKGLSTPNYLAALYPLWDLAQCIAEGYDIPAADRAAAKYSVGYNPWHAYQSFTSICKSHKYIGDVQDFFVQTKLELSLSSIRETLEQKILADTRAVHTEEAYDRLVDALYESPYTDVVLKEREEIAFGQVAHTTKLAEAQCYLDKYHLNEAHSAEVTRLRDRLAFESMPQSAAGCKDYLSKYPRSEYASQVNTLLYDFAYSEMHGSLDGCRRYLNEYPDTPHRKQVEEEIEFFVFDAARSADHPIELRHYLEQYPAGRYLDDARQLLFAAEGRYFLRLDVAFDELESYTDKYDPLDERVINFYNSLYVCEFFYDNLEMRSVPKECEKVSVTYNMELDEDYDLVRGEISQTDTEHFVFRPIGLLAEQDFYTEGYDSDEQLMLRTYYAYTIDEASGVVYPSALTNEGYYVNTGITPSSKHFTAVISNGFLNKLTGSDGQVFAYEYDEDSNLKTKRIGTLKGAKLQDVTTYTYRDGLAVEARSADYHSTMTYNENGDMISTVGAADSGGFADGADWEISDYGPYGWTKSTMEYSGEETEVTRTFQ